MLNNHRKKTLMYFPPKISEYISTLELLKHRTSSLDCDGLYYFGVNRYISKVCVINIIIHLLHNCI